MKNRGFTLIEILIVLAIIAGVMAFAVITTGGSGNQVRKTSFEIVKTIRATYDATLLKHQYQRIVFDLNAQKISVEYSENPFFVRQEADEEKYLKKEEKEEEVEKENTEEDSGFLEDEEEEQITIEKPLVAEFVAVEEDLFEPYELPEGARILDVFVEHQETKLEEGLAYLYFFPKGYTEFALIHLGNEEGEKNLTLVVNPLSGAVEVLEGYVEEEEVKSEDKYAPTI